MSSDADEDDGRMSDSNEGAFLSVPPAPEPAADAESKLELTIPPGTTHPMWRNILALHSNWQARERLSNGKGAYCKLCKKDLKYACSTGNLEKHAKSKHGDLLRELQQPRTGKGSILSSVVVAPTFRQEVVRWAILDYQSIRVVEQPSFQRMIRSLSKGVRIPTRRDVVADIDELEEQARVAIRGCVQGEHLAFSSDAWSADTTESFLAVVASYITKDFKLITLPLECRSFPGSHTAVRINQALDSIFENNGITHDHVTALVIDNASNGKAAGEAAPYDAVFCPPHTLQLTANKVLMAKATAAALKAGRKAFSSFKKSGVRMQLLRKAQVYHNLPVVRLILDVKTRWY